MKIVIAADIYPPDSGGPATYSQKLKTELQQRGHVVTLICYSDQPNNDVLRVSKKGIAPLRYLRYLQQLKKIAQDADVIYAMGPVSAGWPAMQAARKLGKPLVVKVVGDYAWEQARNSGTTELGIDAFQKQKYRGKIGALQKIQRDVCSFAAKVITPSNYLKSIVTGWGIPSEKVEVIHNAHNYEATEYIVDKKHVIVSVGRLVAWKGFKQLINVFSKVNVPDLRLEIYGDGPLRSELQQQINSLGIQDRVSITHIDQPIVQQKLREAQLFVLNTGYEGHSHVVLEALSAGTPVITTNVCGNPEIITDGESGLLVEYNNEEQLKAAIEKLLQDPELAQKLVENGKKSIKKFDYQAMIETTDEALQSVVRL